METSLSSRLLRRYWFPASAALGVGVTAWSLEDAVSLATGALHLLPAGATISHPIEDVDINALDQNHVVPNMGPCNFRGVWYPRG
jgi:hypothetical protein